MNDRKLKIGIIGVGKISELHVPGYMAHPNAEIVAVCDNNESNIRIIAGKEINLKLGIVFL